MKSTLIIAEAGVNHNGSIEIAKQLIDVAAESGVDYVKFQTFKAEKVISKNAIKAEYQIVNTESIWQKGNNYAIFPFSRLRTLPEFARSNKLAPFRP